jgi:hypothetical protein
VAANFEYKYEAEDRTGQGLSSRDVNLEVRVSVDDTSDENYFFFTATTESFIDNSGSPLSVLKEDFTKEILISILESGQFENTQEPSIIAPNMAQAIHGWDGPIAANDKSTAQYKPAFVRRYLEGAFENPRFDLTSEEVPGQNATPTSVRVPGSYKFEATFRFPKNIVAPILEDPFSRSSGRINVDGGGGHIVSSLLRAGSYLSNNFKTFKPGTEIAAANNLIYRSDIENTLYAFIPSNFIEDDDSPTLSQIEAAQQALETAAAAPTAEPISGPGLTKAQRDEALPLNEQAILLYRTGELMGINRKKRNKNQYDRFACVECDSNKEIATLSNYLTSPTDVSALFDRVRPVHLSAVIPRARLFKMYHKGSKRMKGKKIPQDGRKLVEYEFEEYINRSVLSQTLSTNTGIGLESFNWEFNGTNEFESERLINANLKIRAQSIDAIEELRRSTDGTQYRFSDLFIADAMQKDNKGVQGSLEDYIKYDVKNFETRVSVEYAVDKGSPAFKTPGSAGIAEALEKVKIDINLVVVSHTIDLRDDGTLTVDINFIGRLDATAQDPNKGNILPFQQLTEEQQSSLLKDRDNAFAELDQIEATKDWLRREYASPDDKEVLEKEMALANKQISELTAKWKLSDTTPEGRKKYLKGIAENNLSKLRLYRSIINGLLTKRDENGNIDSAIKVLKIDPSNIALTHRLGTEGGTTAAGLTKEGDQAVVTTSNVPITPEIADDKDLQKQDEITDQFKILEERMRKGIIPLFQDDAYYIRFFYFGDLMDVVLDNMYEGKYKGASEDKSDDSSDIDLRTILGPIEIKRNVFDSYQFPGPVQFKPTGKIVVADKYGVYDPAATRETRQAVEQAERMYNGTATEKDKRSTDPNAIIPESVFASLADVPISVNLFLRWFADNISNKGAYGYSFKKFLVDATQSLIVASLQADSTKILLPKQKRIIRTMSWDAPSDPNKPDAFGFVHKPGESLKINLNQDQRGKDSEATKISNIKDNLQKTPLRAGAYMSDYLMIYAEAPRYDRKFTGNSKEYQRDLDDGIYHLTVGRDVGMVKDISLSAVSIPGYEEMQIQRAAKLGQRPTKRVYEATVTMYGTTFFRPGQTVYIHAAAFGSLQNLKAFGLCGYYTVRTTSTNFSSGNFETTLVCDFRHGG